MHREESKSYFDRNKVQISMKYLVIAMGISCNIHPESFCIHFNVFTRKGL